MESIIENIIDSLYSDSCDNKENSRIYKIHKYWARKPWYIVEKYVTSYAAEGELVMDPFCGSGCTGLESVINGRNFIGQDLNPSAIQVTRGTLMNNVNLETLKKDFEIISDKCKSQIMELYITDEVCAICGKKRYFKYVNIGPKFEGKISGCVYCPDSKCKSVKRLLNEKELEDMQAYDKLEISKWVPDVKFPKKFYKDRFSYKGILSVADMYTKRNQYALSLLYEAVTDNEIENKELLMLAFTNTVLHVSKLKGENVRPLGVNNYWVPDDYFEENVWFRFEDRMNNLIKAKQQQNIREKEKNKNGIQYGSWKVQKKSALEDMGEECIDYFFTDPPYGDAIQYSELSYVWNAWLGENYNTKDEVIINPVQDKGAEEFNELLSKSLDNIYRALKPNRYFTLCFQNKNSTVWKEVILHCKELGWQLTDVSIYDTYGSPFNKSWADFSPKSDIYVTFQKTCKPQNAFYEKDETVKGIIKEIINYTKSHEIPADNNKLYDLTISYLIWAMYLNKREMDVKDFDIKKFTQMVQDIMGETEYEQLELNIDE